MKLYVYCIPVGVESAGRLSVPHTMGIRKVMEGTRNFVELIDEPIMKQAAIAIDGSFVGSIGLRACSHLDL